MCPIPACPVLMDYMESCRNSKFELTGEHNSRENHIFSVDQVENFDKLNTSEISEFFLQLL